MKDRGLVLDKTFCVVTDKRTEGVREYSSLQEWRGRDSKGAIEERSQNARRNGKETRAGGQERGRMIKDNKGAPTQ